MVISCTLRHNRSPISTLRIHSCYLQLLALPAVQSGCISSKTRSGAWIRSHGSEGRESQQVIFNLIPNYLLHCVHFVQDVLKSSQAACLRYQVAIPGPQNFCKKLQPNHYRNPNIRHAEGSVSSVDWWLRTSWIRKFALLIFPTRPKSFLTLSKQLNLPFLQQALFPLYSSPVLRTGPCFRGIYH